MPKVPNLNELEIAARGLPNVAFIPVEARTHNISQAPNLQQQARSRGFGNGGAHLNTGGVKKAELNDTDAAYQAAKQAGALQQGIGQGLASFGLALQDIAQKERAKADDARIQDAKNQFLRAQLDQEYGEDGWRARKGAAAMPSGDNHRPLDDEYDDRINESYQQISQSLGNDRQRELFREWADSERLQQRAKIRAHAMREYDSYKENTYQARKELAAETVLRGDVERGIALLQENNTRYADENGLPPEWLMEANRTGVSRELTTAAGQMIDSGDLAGANALLEKYRGHISGEDLAKAAATLKTAQEIRQATDDAEALIRGGDVNFAASSPGDAHAIYNQGYNLDDVIQKIVGVESGGKATAKNPKSSAYGLGQFTKSTWKRFAESPVGKMLKGKMDMVEWLAARATPAIAMQGMRWLTQLNAEHLEKHGVPANATTLYLAHFMGAQGAVNLYQADPNQNARAFLHQSDPKHADAIIKANPTVFTEKRSVGDIVAWSAKHMGVKPDPNAPATGEPRPRSWPSDAQLEAEAQRRYPDNPAQQRAYTDRVRIARNVELEAQKQANDDAYTRAYVAVHSGQGFASIAPEDLKHLTPQQIVGLNESAESIEAKQQQKQHAAARVETLKLSRDPDALMAMTDKEIFEKEGIIGVENIKVLLTARDNMMKDDSAAKAYKLGKTAVDSLLRKAYGDDFLDDKDYKQQAENARYFLDGEQLQIINGLIASGQEITPERLMQELETALLQKRIIEVPGWLWGTNKKEKYLAQLEPWQQEQFRAAERLALEKQHNPQQGVGRLLVNYIGRDNKPATTPEPAKPAGTSPRINSQGDLPYGDKEQTGTRGWNSYGD